MPVSLLNARHVRNYASAGGQLAKTDPIDTAVIGAFAKHYNPPTLGPEWVAQEELQQHHRRPDGLIATRAERKTSLEFYSGPSIRAEIKREITALNRRIGTYREKIARTIAADAEKRRKQQAMEQITGVGAAQSPLHGRPHSSLPQPDVQNLLPEPQRKGKTSQSSPHRGRQKTTHPHQYHTQKPTRLHPFNNIVAKVTDRLAPRLRPKD